MGDMCLCYSLCRPQCKLHLFLLRAAVLSCLKVLCLFTSLVRSFVTFKALVASETLRLTEAVMQERNSLCEMFLVCTQIICTFLLNAF